MLLYYFTDALLRVYYNFAVQILPASRIAFCNVLMFNDNYYDTVLLTRFLILHNT